MPHLPGSGQSLLYFVVADVKFDAVSGDYYPILYFNDYWNLQKDYFPINASLQHLPFRLSFCPLSLWRWQLYAAQSTKSPWNFLGEDLYEQSDEEQDSVKVRHRARPWLAGPMCHGLSSTVWASALELYPVAVSEVPQHQQCFCPWEACPSSPFPYTSKCLR